MKKSLLIFLFTLFSFLFILPHHPAAQTSVDSVMPEKTMELIRYPRPQLPIFFGHEHAYTVTFRGNGEAHVVLKAAFTNSAEATSSAVIFKISNTTPKDLTAYQVIRQGQCLVYKPYSQGSLDSSVQDCAQYDDPNYFEPYYYGNVTYKKATPTVDGEQIQIQLPESIPPEKSGSVLLFYTSPFYTSRTLFGAYEFDFETLKVDQPIRALQVGINTDTNLKIKGVSADVEYRNVFSPSIAMSEFSKGYSTDSSAQYFGQIGSGRLVKNAYELQPNETFTVQGIYARSWWSLYAMEVIIAVAVIIVVGIFMIVLLRKLYGKLQNAIKSESKEEEGSKNKHTILVLLGISFISSFLIGGYSIFQFFIISLIQNQYYDATVTLFIGLSLFLISIFIYGLLFIGPPVYIGLKKGVMWGIGTFVSILCWLFMYVMIFLLLAIYLRTMFSNRYMPMPVSMPILNGIEKSEPTSIE